MAKKFTRAEIERYNRIFMTQLKKRSSRIYLQVRKEWGILLEV
jgi:hypothetical protein